MKDNQSYQEILDTWLSALKQGLPDAELTQKVASLVAQHGDSALTDLLSELDLKQIQPTLQTWLEEPTTDLPVDSIVPYLDFSFLASSAEPPSTVQLTNDWVQRMQDAVQVGIQWTTDGLGALCLGLNLQEGAAPQVAWSTKTQHESQLLFHYGLEQSKELEWIVEVSAFTESAETYRVEVALLKLDALDADLTDISVILVAGDAEAVEQSDESGIAEFSGLPLDGLGTVLIRIGFYD